MKQKKEISLLKWLQRYWSGVFLVLLLIYFPMQAVLMTMLESRLEENVHTSIGIAESGIETNLGIIDSFLYESLYSNTTQSTSQLYHDIRYEKDPLSLNSARLTVQNSLRSIVSWSDMIDFIIVYTDRDDGFLWLEAGKDENYLQRQYTKQEIIGSLITGKTDRLNRYTVFHTPAGNCMIRFLKIDGSYLAVSVSGQKLMDALMSASRGSRGVAFVAEPDGSCVFSTVDNLPILLSEQEGKYVRLNGEAYFQSGHISPITGYYFGILTPKSELMSDLWLFRGLFLTIFLLLSGALSAFFHAIRKEVEKPIGDMVGTMNAIAEGNLTLNVSEVERLGELRQLAKTFNHMLHQVKQLKIEKYEVQLEAQKAAMQYLQLQIKPHFYVNMLNIIYSLAERKDFAMIQKVSHAVVCFSRYMFRDASELVELRREIEHVQYYMEIQQIRYSRLMECSIRIPEEIRSAQVPPFVIQSFVENSAKYAFSANDVCRIVIEAGTDSAKQTLTIRIRDNGTGYSEDYLSRDWNRKSEAGHIGLTNIHQRLKLIFDDRAEIRLYNDGGAVAEISMPYISIQDLDLEE